MTHLSLTINTAPPRSLSQLQLIRYHTCTIPPRPGFAWPPWLRMRTSSMNLRVARSVPRELCDAIGRKVCAASCSGSSLAGAPADDRRRKVGRSFSNTDLGANRSSSTALIGLRLAPVAAVDEWPRSVGPSLPSGDRGVPNTGDASPSSRGVEPRRRRVASTRGVAPSTRRRE